MHAIASGGQAHFALETVGAFKLGFISYHFARVTLSGTPARAYIPPLAPDMFPMLRTIYHRGVVQVKILRGELGVKRAGDPIPSFGP